MCSRQGYRFYKTNEIRDGYLYSGNKNITSEDVKKR